MEVNSAKKNIYSSLFFIIISFILYFFVIPKGIPLRASWGGEIGVDSRTFPYFAAGLMGIASIIQLVISLFEYKTARKSTISDMGLERSNLKEEMRAILIFGLFIVYGILLRYTGFIIATIIVPPIVLYTFNERKISHYLYVYAFGGFMFVVFEKLLMVQLP